LLPSREDPYPVVVLEAAAEKIPTVCFENSGGAPEFVCPDAGTVAPYLDVEATTNILISFYHDRNVVDTYGRKAFEKVKRLHGDKQLILSQFNDGIEKTLHQAQKLSGY
jgi:glycosyltransferase involved in cell wall biosynthesis